MIASFTTDTDSWGWGTGNDYVIRYSTTAGTNASVTTAIFSWPTIGFFAATPLPPLIETPLSRWRYELWGEMLLLRATPRHPPRPRQDRPPIVRLCRPRFQPRMVRRRWRRTKLQQREV